MTHAKYYHIGWLTIFGLGYLPFSASIASLLAIGCYAGVCMITKVAWTPYAMLGIVTAITVIISFARASYTETDPPEAVIDEFLAMLACVVIAGTENVLALCALFVLFRVLDILKPPPIRTLDEKLHGAIGYLIDDLAICVPLGILARILLAALRIG